MVSFKNCTLLLFFFFFFLSLCACSWEGWWVRGLSTQRNGWWDCVSGFCQHALGVWFCVEDIASQANFLTCIASLSCLKRKEKQCWFHGLSVIFITWECCTRPWSFSFFLSSSLRFDSFFFFSAAFVFILSGLPNKEFDKLLLFSFSFQIYVFLCLICVRSNFQS